MAGVLRTFPRQREPVCRQGAAVAAVCGELRDDDLVDVLDRERRLTCVRKRLGVTDES